MTAMKTTIIFVVVFVAFFGCTLAADNHSCNNPQILQTCYLNFFKSLNIPATLDKFPAYNDYLNVFNSYNTPTHLNEFCNSVYNLTKCLETNDAYKCVSPDGFTQIKVNGEDAYDYPTNYGIITYTCGEGMEAWKKIINCTTSNSKAINDANTACEQAFEKTDQSCSSLVTFLQCTYTLLKKDCGQDAYTFACKADTNGIKYSTPNCVGNMIDCNPSNLAVTYQFYFWGTVIFGFLML